ncbi:MAG: DUF6351 family protein [Alkalimonas sp.]|nr:DUF6351 family protein [Alkalimonas sp.]
MRVLKWLLLLSLVLALILLWPGTEIPASYFSANPVQAVPKVRQGDLVQVDDFIGRTERPADPYAYPIPLGEVGPSTPLFSGPQQYPFYCAWQQMGIEPPLIDNDDGYGVAVLDEHGQLQGYSKDCLHPSRLLWYTLNSAGEVSSYQGGSLAADELLLRAELGTIQRHFYLLVMPVQLDEFPQRTGKTQWNGKLIYQFHGGVGIGFRQGELRIERLLRNRTAQLRQGYAVVSSSANRTSHTYHFLRAEEVARQVKQHFISLYGEPGMTIGIGGSGGGIAQYLLAQNAPGLLDAAIAQYSYPDMLSQVQYALDCDLLHNYYYFTAENKTFWQSWRHRQWVEGLSTVPDQQVRYRREISAIQLLSGMKPTPMEGATQCINAWFGLSSMVHNPHQGRLRPFVSDAVLKSTHWSYWEDLVDLYGRDEHGFAHSLWDNTGVQYGLQALRDGKLSPEQFIELNARIGSWLPAHQMQPEQARFLPFWDTPIWLSAFGRHNMAPLAATEAGIKVASRYRANREAMERAYRYGQLFIGKLSIPVLDLRHYLDPVLDMHHLQPSFMARERLAMHGNDHWQRIWVSHPDYTPEQQAFDAVVAWLREGQAPDSAADRCFAANGQVIAQGDDVWQQGGVCQQTYPVLSNSREQAGAPSHGLLLQCALKPVEQALAQGEYGQVDMTPWLHQLQQIFPDGVCDYQQSDLAYPADWAAASEADSNTRSSRWTTSSRPQ